MQTAGLIVAILLCFGGRAIAGPTDEIISRANQLLSQGQVDGAAALVDSGLIAFPGDTKLLLLQGDIFLTKGRFEEALQSYELVLARSGKDPAAIYGAGMAALKAGQAEKAVNYFQRGVATGKRKGEFYYGLGLAYMQLGNLAEADLAERKAIKEDSKKASYHAALADVNFRKGVWAIAIDEYARALALDSSQVYLFNRLGESYYQSARFDEAVRYFKEYFKRVPSDTSAAYRLARIFEASNNPAEAVFFYRKLTELDPQNGDFWYGLGTSLYNLKEYTEAGQALERAVALGTKVAESYGLLAKIYQTTKEYYRADSAYSRYEQYVGAPTDADYWIDKGKVMVKIGETEPTFLDRAVESFDRAIRLDSSNATAWEYAGLARYYKKEYRQAIPYIKRKLELENPNPNVNTLRNLAFCYLKIEQYDQAAATLEEAIRLKPEDAVMRHMLGNIYKFKLQCDKAVEHLKVALKDTTGAISTADKCKIRGNIGFCYVVLRECQNAIPYLEPAVECDPNNEEVLLSMAQAYHLCNDIKKANAFYRKVLDINPNNKAAIEGEARTHIR